MSSWQPLCERVNVTGVVKALYPHSVHFSGNRFVYTFYIANPTLNFSGDINRTWYLEKTQHTQDNFSISVMPFLGVCITPVLLVSNFTDSDLFLSYFEAE